MSGLIQYIPRDSPRQAQIVNHLRRRIVAGEFAPGSKLPSVTQIVREFGASNTTVQRALGHLRDSGYIASKKSRGTYVSENPPHLCHIGVVYGCTEEDSAPSSYYTAIRAETIRVSGEEHPEGLAWRFSHCYANQNSAEPKERAELIHAVETHRFAGLIFINEPPQELADTPVMRQKGLPRVLIGLKEGMPCVGGDSSALPVMALDYLQARGRSRVAFVVCCNQQQHVAATCDGLMPLVEARGMITHRYWIHGTSLEMRDWAANSVELMMRCGGQDRPDGLVILDDNFVPDVTDALVAAGVDVPGELEVVAHTNMPYPTRSAVPAVRLSFDVSKVIDTAVDLIGRQIRGEEVPARIAVKPELQTEQTRHA